jgi:hypothetical protein
MTHAKQLDMYVCSRLGSRSRAHILSTMALLSSFISLCLRYDAAPVMRMYICAKCVFVKICQNMLVIPKSRAGGGGGYGTVEENGM